MLSDIFSNQSIGLIAGSLTASSMLPQFLKILKDKKADDISVPMLLILITGLGMWIYYGTIQKDWPLILTNSFSLILNVLILIFKFRYRNNAAQAG